MTGALTHEGLAERLAEDLAEHPTVAETSIDTTRRPHRVGVNLSSERLPDGVQDILEQHEASIVAVENMATSGLALDLEPAESWKPAGQRTVRAHGGSIVCTLTREALEASGLGEDTRVNLEARENQVRITRRDP